jgi:multidrug transporter EmrE-like cation transporter
MNWINNVICIILAFFSAFPVLLVRSFIGIKYYSSLSIFSFIFELIFALIVVIAGYFYLIYKKISMATFYPIIKIIELLIPVAISILYYKDKLIPINYVGIVLSVISIICLEWEKKK